MMIKTVEEFLEEFISEDLVLAVLSGCRKKDLPSRVRIRPVELKGFRNPGYKGDTHQLRQG